MQEGNEEQGLRERLASLLKEHPQAKIARETETTPSNISRYANGMRVPALFCMRLVARLGVNPSWLLTGEGAVYLSDVNAATGMQAGNLLELVRAMSAISKAKLGALSGRPDRRMLRELDDAISAYERVRAQLKVRTAAFMEDMLRQLQAAIERRDLVQAEFLCRACRQASRFADEPEHLRALDHFEAHILSWKRLDESALKLQRAAIVRYLVLSEPDVLAIQEIKAHAVYLLRVGRIEDCRRTARAAQELAMDLQDTSDYQMLRLSEGMAITLLGRVREGSQVVLDACNRMGPSELEYYASELASVRWFLGLVDAAGLVHERREWLRAGKHEAVGASMTAVMSFCFWEGDAILCREALELHTCNAKVRHLVSPFLASYTELLCDLRHGKRGGSPRLREFLASREHLQRIEAESPVDRFRGHVTACELGLLAGDRVIAEREFAATEKLNASLGKRYQVPVLQMGLHYRNALELAKRKWRLPAAATQRAAEFFDTHFRLGFACYREYATGREGIRTSNQSGGLV